jgi:predicted nuclease with TOPRIM domain
VLNATELQDEVENLKAIVNNLYDAVSGLEDENKRLREAARRQSQNV